MEINYLFEFFDFLAGCSVWLAKWLSARQKRICFVIFSVHALYWVMRGYMLGLHVAPMFSICNVMLNAYGFIYWGKTLAKRERKSV